MERSSIFEEVQEEQLENDEKPPDPGGLLFKQKCNRMICFGGNPLIFAGLCISKFPYQLNIQAESKKGFLYIDIS